MDMDTTKIHPDLKQKFSEMITLDFDWETIDMEEARRLVNARNAGNPIPTDKSVTITNKYIPGPSGAPDIQLRIYKPTEHDEFLPGILWIHGGGYMFGKVESDDYLCQKFVSEARCVVVSVDYRLAPENPFPAPLEDCYTSFLWLHEKAQELSVDRSRIAIAGPSAGGGLTAALALLVRDRKGPSIVFQMPLYPMIDHRSTTPSSYEIMDHRVWSRKKNIHAWKMYLGEHLHGEISPYASPALATDLSGLPPTYTCIGTLDLFRDETIDYVKRLNQAGVPTEFHLYPGCFHAFERVEVNAEVSKRAVNQYIQVLKSALGS
ncbi:alpha/beta hydrolase [Evansella sp. AB-P1]|uniref:alpha/beta hydrolase n=1 Tax=Evansella sp. AB-P1 TaxID=3037653 RepID=UPI00242031E9|nr:alpha/beta hydrolase [Evansella sp. AB-P1]MDG5789876.1 alpha/beta hydrolase [Evansella sp. AB-P1]